MIRFSSRGRAAVPVGDPGFTLLELMVAIVLTGVVALLVYGSAGVAVDTQERVAERAREIRARQAWRATLQEAFRNMRPAAAFGDTAFSLEERSIGGRPTDRVSFTTAGSMPPLTADSDWTVTLETSDEGLVLWAQPVGVLAPPRRVLGVPGITGLDVRVFDPGPPAQWGDAWPYPRLVPVAVELTYWADDGPVGPAERLWLPLGGVQW